MPGSWHNEFQPYSQLINLFPISQKKVGLITKELILLPGQLLIYAQTSLGLYISLPFFPSLTENR